MRESSTPDRDSDFDVERYVDEMTALRKDQERRRKREEQLPTRRLAIATSLSLIWTPSVIFAVYAIRWSSGLPELAEEGIRRFQAWPWLVGSLVLTAYSLFYGIAASLAGRENAESHKVAIGSFYGFWVCLPMFLMYPGTKRLGLWSDGYGIWAFVLIGLGQTVYAWCVSRVAETITKRAG
ncbi:MAG: emopamil-binding family protein [Acidobacteriota bacterium]